MSLENIINRTKKSLKRLGCIGLTTIALASTSFGGTLVRWDVNESTVMPPTGNDYVAVGAGYAFQAALKSNGSIVAWGNNPYGQLDEQLDVPDGNNYIDIKCGFDYGLALHSDGSLVGWGANNFGQCDVPPGDDYVAIAAGFHHGIALKSDGSIVAWGENEGAALEVPSDNNYVAIASGGSHNLALRNDGTLWSILDGMPDGNDFVFIECGGAHDLAIKSDGTLLVWGSNSCGQRNVPDGNYIAANGGYHYTVAIRLDSSLAAWGLNNVGQCNVPGGTGFVALSAFYEDNLALTSDETSTLTMTSEPNDMINLMPPEGQHTCYRGQRISISASRSPKCPYVYDFDYWEGDINDPNSAFQYLIMDTDKTINAVYIADERRCGDECHPILQGDVNGDCYIDFEDFAIYADQWLSCTHPDCD